jgi:hypothetical protein
MKMSRKPSRLVRIWDALKWIHEWNRFGGREIYDEPIDLSPKAMRERKKQLRQENLNSGKWGRKNKPEYRIGVIMAI